MGMNNPRIIEVENLPQNKGRLKLLGTTWYGKEFQILAV